MSEEIITTTKENILKTHAEGCSATKKALENLYPGVFKQREFDFYNGNIFFWANHPMLAVNMNKNSISTGQVLAHLDHNSGWENWTTAKECGAVRPMTSGTILLTIKDGKIAKAEVKED